MFSTVFHPISSILTHSLPHREFCLSQVCPCAQLCHILPQQHKPAQFQTLDLLPPIPCTSTDTAALGTVKADPDTDHSCPEEWAGKDRTSTAPSSNHHEAAHQGATVCSSLGQSTSMHFTDYPFTASPFPHSLILSNPYADLCNIKHSSSFGMKLISWTPLSSLLTSSTNRNSFLQKTYSMLPKVQLKPKPMLVVFPK